MPSFNTEVLHELSQEQAIDRLKGFLDRVKEHYKDQVSRLEESWADNVLSFSMTTYGIKIDGSLTVEEERVAVAGSLPFIALPYKGRIQDSITSELKKALEGSE